MPTKPSIKVGDQIYYRSTDCGNTFRHADVIGETSRSWIVIGANATDWQREQPDHYATKIPKSLKGLEFGTKERADLVAWAMQNSYYIREMMSYGFYDADKILAIAKILGYPNLPEGHNATIDTARIETSNS